MRSILLLCLIPVLSACVINQPYSKAGENFRTMNDPTVLSDEHLTIEVIGLNVDSLLEVFPNGTFIHTMSSTCRPCIKKILVLDSLHSDYGLTVKNIVLDDWGKNQHLKKLIMDKTSFREVFILSNDYYSKKFSNQERIERFEKALCDSCSPMTYYSVGYIMNGKFHLLEQEEDLKKYFTTYLTTTLDSAKLNHLINVFEVKERIR